MEENFIEFGISLVIYQILLSNISCDKILIGNVDFEVVSKSVFLSFQIMISQIQVAFFGNTNLQLH